MIKVNSLNFFDKGFFGKTMAEYAKENASRKVLNSSSLKMNSIDDFNKHFDIISNAPKWKECLWMIFMKLFLLIFPKFFRVIDLNNRKGEFYDSIKNTEIGA